MTQKPDFDLQSAHKYFSASSFNSAWDLIENSERSDEQDREMLRLSFASLYHWTQREDVKDTNLSVAYWQISRIYALLNQAENARRYAELSLDKLDDALAEPFLTAYAYEALARAAMVAGRTDLIYTYKAQAENLLEKIVSTQEREMIAADLETIH